jgi:hypothetical protein
MKSFFTEAPQAGEKRKARDRMRRSLEFLLRGRDETPDEKGGFISRFFFPQKKSGGQELFLPPFPSALGGNKVDGRGDWI